MNKLKRLLPGIVIGIVIALVGVVVWDNIQSSISQKRAVAFIEDFGAAKDKQAFVKNYDFGNRGGVSISNSSADEGSDIDLECKRFFKMAEAVDGMLREMEILQMYGEEFDENAVIMTRAELIEILNILDRYNCYSLSSYN